MRIVFEMMNGRLRGHMEEGDSLDCSNSAMIKRAAAARLGDGIDMELDLSAVRLIDSSGVGCLVSILKAARRNGCSLTLTALTPQVLSVLEVIRLTAIFDIRPAPAPRQHTPALPPAAK